MVTVSSMSGLLAFQRYKLITMKFETMVRGGEDSSAATNNDVITWYQLMLAYQYDQNIAALLIV